jgi:RNA polymerase sigma-70 factor (ECF subfamily)
MADEYDVVEWTETSTRIRALISRLPEQQQTVIYLRDIEQNEYNEIEEITGLNANAIRVNLSRARKKVRDELLKTWNHESEHSKDITAKIL